MVKPKVSVIVPVYNKEAYLKQTLEALRSQTLRELEIILIDDGSTDASGQICEDYAARDSRFQVIHQPNRGVSAARNAGLDAARGEFIGFCDADDIPAADLYETLLELATQNGCDIAMVKESVRYLGGSEVSDQTGTLMIYDDREAVLRQYLLEQISMSNCTKLIRRELTEQIRFEVGRRIHEDKFYLFEVFCQTDKVCYLDVCKYAYIRNDSSCSLSPFTEKYLDMLYFADKIQDVCDKNYPHLSDHAAAGGVITYLRFLQTTLLWGDRTKLAAERKQAVAHLRRVSDHICKTHLPQKQYVKWRICKLGQLPYLLAVKLLSREA